MTLGEGQSHSRKDTRNSASCSAVCNSAARPVGSAMCGMSVPEKNSDLCVGFLFPRYES